MKYDFAVHVDPPAPFAGCHMGRKNGVPPYPGEFCGLRIRKRTYPNGNTYDCLTNIYGVESINPLVIAFWAHTAWDARAEKARIWIINHTTTGGSGDYFCAMHRRAERAKEIAERWLAVAMKKEVP